MRCMWTCSFCTEWCDGFLQLFNSNTALCGARIFGLDGAVVLQFIRRMVGVGAWLPEHKPVGVQIWS